MSASRDRRKDLGAVHSSAVAADRSQSLFLFVTQEKGKTMSASRERERERFAGQHSSIENVTIQPKFT